MHGTPMDPRLDPRDDPLTAALDALLRCDEEARQIIRQTHLGGISEHARRIRETVAEILPEAEIERAEASDCRRAG